MKRSLEALDLRQLRALLRGDVACLRGWLERPEACRAGFYCAVILLGAGLFGMAMGCWRSGLQALYTGIKVPLVVLLTTAANALLNGMLAPLLGLRMGFRQCCLVILMSFAIAAVMLAAFSPLAAFIVWNTPPLTAASRHTSPEFAFLKITLTVFIAVAGVTGNVRLLPLLGDGTGSVAVARKVLLAWLAVNLLLGSQICWVLRPFIWDPKRPVEFIMPESHRGSFCEELFEDVRDMIF
jgi:hypothetical protein